MSSKSSSSTGKTHDGQQPKGETQPRTHKGGPNASNNGKPKHEKDDSNSTDKTDTKKNPNSI